MNVIRTAMAAHFAAFQARFQAAAGAYERRNAPDISATLQKIAESFEDHKKRSEGTITELRNQVERLDTRLSRPGALHEPGPAADGAATSWTVNGKSVQLLRSPSEIRSHYERRSEDRAPITIADFVRGVAGMSTSPEARAVLSVGTDADGGHMVPSRLMSGVLSALVPESAVLGAGAGILALDAADFGGKSFTVAATDTVPSAAWRLENGDVAESSPGFRAVVMTPRSLSFFFKISRELLADAAGIDTTLTLAIAQAFAKRLDVTALLGTGTAPEPRGIVNTVGVNAVGNGTNGASLATTRYANLFTGVQAILQADGPMPTAAIMSPRSRVVLASQLDTTGQPLQVPDMLRSLRMLYTSQLPNNLTVGSSSDCSSIVLGDFTKMVFAMRERMSIQKLDEAFATSGQVGFIAHCRCDIGVMYPKAFAVVTGVRP